MPSYSTWYSSFCMCFGSPSLTDGGAFPSDISLIVGEASSDSDVIDDAATPATTTERQPCGGSSSHIFGSIFEDANPADAFVHLDDDNPHLTAVSFREHFELEWEHAMDAAKCECEDVGCTEGDLHQAEMLLAFSHRCFLANILDELSRLASDDPAVYLKETAEIVYAHSRHLMDSDNEGSEESWS
eukprot:gnl/MRDRNA2_/MRDRNA2_116452_c0_seq1.p2 gnl/MRDRNA2_/MRDRNA2_116452_c0~~gnl/MRDRNA2_/MRDRNA2_116452_c0_seq1.p2  ORF type:complete len:186 (+),score=40.44 gnl/MRDRNA2_/MRDRNA2_116452_c0_seq1:683-1240(+)